MGVITNVVIRDFAQQPMSLPFAGVITHEAHFDSQIRIGWFTGGSMSLLQDPALQPMSAESYKHLFSVKDDVSGELTTGMACAKYASVVEAVLLAGLHGLKVAADAVETTIDDLQKKRICKA